MTGKHIMNTARRTEAAGRLNRDFDAIDSIFCKTAKDAVLEYQVDYITIAWKGCRQNWYHDRAGFR